MLRKLIPAGAIVALLIGTAAAQDTPGIPVNPRKQPTSEELEKRKADDRAYDEAMKKIPNKKLSVDPWGDVRPSAPPTAKNKQQQ
jgi:hypothetical protein